MNSISFTTSGVKQYKIFGMLFPMSSYLLIVQELEKISNNNTIEYTKISLQTSEQICLNIPSKINSKDKINKLLEIINSFGFGKFEIKILSKSKIIISQKKYISKILEHVHQLKSSNISENIISHLILNSLEEMLHINIHKFKLTQTNTHLFYTFEHSSLHTNILQSKMYLNNQKNNQNHTINSNYTLIKNPIITKIEHEKQLIIKNGIISLWKTSGIFIPFEILNKIFEIISKYSPNKLETIAQLQLYSAVELQRNVFGIKDNDKIFHSLLLQTALIGMGDTKVKTKNKDIVILQLYTQLFEDLDNNNKNYENLKIFYLFILKGIVEFGLNTQASVEKNSLNNEYIFTLLPFKRELSSEELEFTNVLSANIQINKFI